MIKKIEEHEKDYFESVVQKYDDYVRQRVQKAFRRLPPLIGVLDTTCLFDDFLSVGRLGLIEAAQRYETEKGSFFAYAHYRIEGNILDEARKYDFITRSIRRDLRRIKEIQEKFLQRHFQEPNIDEIARYTGFSKKYATYLLSEIQCIVWYSIEEFFEHSRDELSYEPSFPLLEYWERFVGRNSAEDDLVKKERKHFLLKAMDCLPSRDQLVLRLYLYEEKTMQEIADFLHVTESRISRIYTHAAKQRLKPILSRLLNQEVTHLAI